MLDINAYLNSRRDLVDAAISLAVGDGSVPETLCRAMCYSLKAKGKRLRPILVIAGAEAVGGDAKRVMPVCVAIEMIHTFSLIHDDLPAMDNDSLRRGVPTNHRVFGEAMALLAGDGLLAEAFSVLARADGADPCAVITTIRDIADATGGRGMTGGQATDILATGRRIGERELTDLHLSKTGALIRASCTAGARLSGASDDQIAALSQYGEALGLAFQIADDILDIEGIEKEIGKDVGSDESKAKATFPSVIGMEESKRRAASLAEKAQAALSRFDDRAEPLRLIARYVIERKK